MTQVPIVIPPPTPSANAIELGNELTETIDRFRQENPNLSATEIHQALSLAIRDSGADSSKAALIVALAICLLIFGLAAFLYLA